MSSYVYLRSRGDFRAMNDEYKAYPGWPKTTHKTARGDDLDLPVRTTMTGDLLAPSGALVEITIIALRKGAERTIVQPAEWGEVESALPVGNQVGRHAVDFRLVASNKRGGQYIRGDMRKDVTQTLTDIGEALSTAGMSHADVVFSRVYIQDQALGERDGRGLSHILPQRPLRRERPSGPASWAESLMKSLRSPSRLRRRLSAFPNADVAPSASPAVVVGNRFFQQRYSGRDRRDER